jgi:hypothetical protein
MGMSSSRYRQIFAELIVIVAGVLVALAIDEWRENQGNKSVEREYVHQLVSDLRSTEKLVVSALEYNASADAAASRLLAVFETGEAVEPEEIRKLLEGLFNFDNPVPVLGTADALVATGDLRLIRDPEIRSEITRYLSYTRDYVVVPIYDLEQEYRTHYATFLKLAAAYGVAPTSSNVEGRLFNKPDPGAFLADTEAYAELSRIMFYRGFFQGYRGRLATGAAATRELLEQYLH